MQGDFTRLTFDPSKNYSRVLMQQGRVQLDADWNEAADIQLYLLRALARDLIGPHGGPNNSELGFEIKEATDAANNQPIARDFQIGTGRYYVDGIMCESRGSRFKEQAGFDKDSFGDLSGDRARTGLVYLDVWERHVTSHEDADESKIGIHEPALRGLDTTTRAQVICQARFLELAAADRTNYKTDHAAFVQLLASKKLTGRGGGKLSARANPPANTDTLCTTAPEARYRGAENQLYRVEIHKGGVMWNGVRAANGQPAGNIDDAATFKWSRENGSVVFPVKSATGKTVTLETFGRDGRLGLQAAGWVELVNDDYVLRQGSTPLLEIDELLTDELVVQLKTDIKANVNEDDTKHALLRRWDSAGTIPVTMDATKNGGWLTLEDGIEIKFELGQNEVFRAGDYWLIPARVATGDVDWPGTSGAPLPLPPHGIEHHYAPLAIISLAADGKVTANAANDLRRKWPPLAQ